MGVHYVQFEGQIRHCDGMDMVGHNLFKPTYVVWFKLVSLNAHTLHVHVCMFIYLYPARLRTYTYMHIYIQAPMYIHTPI